jgi:hypothetical protein
MKLVVTGSSGLIGSALVESLWVDGHEVVKLVRRDPSGTGEARWDPAAGVVDDAAIAGADAVVNLAGAGIGDKRWTPAYKAEIRKSRIDATTTIAKAVAHHDIGVLVSASAVGWYGDRGDDLLTEAEPSGTGFLADVVRDWEAATKPAAAARVVKIRSGIVLSPNGGSGRQWFPWISLADEIAAIRFALDNAAVSGPLNLTGPQPVTNRELTAALGRALHRPAFAFVPKIAMRIGLGEFAEEGVLASQRAVPQVLLDAGFAFADQTLDAALASML